MNAVNHANPTRQSRGFTLTELAIAFFIISLLLASAFMPLASQVEVRNIADSKRVMEQMREAIIGFAQTNGRLPCPARGATAAGTTDNTYVQVFGAGVEQYDSTNLRCYTALGVVPWSTLGVPETDAWGRRITYRVAPAFADDISRTTWQSRSTDPTGAQSLTSPVSPGNQSPICPSSGVMNAPTPTPTQSSFALCTLGDMAVLTRNISDHSVATALGTGLPAVLISHGKNGNGAWQSTGVALAAAAANTDELANSSGTTIVDPSTPPPTVSNLPYRTYAFYSRTQSPSASSCNDTSGTSFCEFDDIVVMISAPTLVSRMVSAGRLP
jgi:type II secretory pathway pseudopilin PulG